MLTGSREAGIHPPATVADLIDVWLEHIRPKLRENSFSVYHNFAHNYIISTIGQVPLQELDQQTLQNFINNLRNKGLSEKSIWDINSKLNSALGWAKEQGLIEHTAYCVKIKQISEGAPKTLSSKEELILEHYLMSAPNPCKLGILLCLKAGISVGELCALLWQDIDLNKRTITINKSLQRIKKALPIDSERPKTLVTILPQKERILIIPLSLVACFSQVCQKTSGYFLKGKTNAYVEPRMLQIKLKRYLGDCGMDGNTNFQVIHNTFIYSSLAKGENPIQVAKAAGIKKLDRILERFENIVV